MSEIYRDRTEGASAKRRDLLTRRRDELATMPHAIRRVVVARSARIAASLAVIVTGTVLLAAAMKPSAFEWLPNHGALLSTLLAVTWIAGVSAWWVARARTEHKFAVAMSRYVLPGGDLDHDLQRLDHEHPDQAAREMAYRLEVRSAALPVLAIAMLVPATCVYLFQLAHTRDWPMLSILEDRLTDHAAVLVALACVGLAGALAATSSSVRGKSVAALAAPFAVVGGLAAAIAAFKLPGAIAWTSLALFVVAAPIALAARRLGLERAAIAVDDPAAGSELLTIRGLVRSLRAGLARARRYWRPALGCAAIAAGVAVFGVVGHKTKAKPEGSPQLAAVPVDVEPSAITKSGYHVEPQSDGTLRIDVVFDGGTAVDIPMLGDLDGVPQGWRAKLAVTTDYAGRNMIVQSYAERDPGVRSGPDHTDITVRNCDGGDHPLGLHLEPPAIAPTTHVVVTVEPTLALAGCTP